MIHEKDDVLKIANVLAEKVIAFNNKCKNEEFTDDNIKCHELDDIASLARLVTADTKDIGNEKSR